MIGIHESEEAPGFLHRISHPKKRAFLAAYCETFNVSRTAALIGVSRRIHYHWIRTDSAYREAFEIARAMAAGNLEDAAVSRAKDGQRDYKFYRGKPIMIACPADHPEAVDQGDGENPRYVRHYYDCSYSDTLLIFLLKGALPEKYRERYPYRHDDENVIERAKQLVDQLAEKKAAEMLAEREGTTSSDYLSS